MATNNLAERLNQLNPEETNNFVEYLSQHGINLEKIRKASSLSDKTRKIIDNYFVDEETATDIEGNTVKETNDEANETEEKEQVNFEVINKNTNKRRRSNGGETKSTILKKYKTEDNLIHLTEIKETTFEDVTQLSDDSFGCYMRGSDLVELFLNHHLVFDPTMQRGVKEDKKGIIHANFKESHVKEIYNSILNGDFTPTQIRLAIITDDEDVDYEYSEDDKELRIIGKVRLLDGQHRIRAMVKIHTESMFKEIYNVNLDNIIFNVVIDAVTATQARTIYANIDKNLKLDKSQVRQLSSDPYATIVNFLNQSPDSDLKDKIATSKPVGTRLVLFNNLAEKIQENVKINTVAERNEVQQYLQQFFNYVAEKIVGFQNDEAVRVEFRKNNLLNENNFFQTWVKIAFIDRENYKTNIDKIAENIEFFNKDAKDENGEYIWLKHSAIKVKAKGDGFAMNNTSVGINALTNRTLELLGYTKK